MLKKVKLIQYIIMVFAFTFLFSTGSWALNIDKVKSNFLEGDYKAAIQEGEKLMAGATHSPDLDALYYYLGLSYLKDGNYLRASDIFEIILSEFKGSSFREEAKLGLGDSCFLRKDLACAENYYRQLLKDNPRTKLLPLLYYRLSQLGFKKGDINQGKEFEDKLKQGFPLCLESRLNKDLLQDQDLTACKQETFGPYYTVQVGLFSSLNNANNLSNKLSAKGYDSFVEETVYENKKSYRVKVGKLKSRSDAVELKNKLSQEGYPTKITP